MGLDAKICHTPLHRGGFSRFGRRMRQRALRYTDIEGGVSLVLRGGIAESYSALEDARRVLAVLGTPLHYVPHLGFDRSAVCRFASSPPLRWCSDTPFHGSSVKCLLLLLCRRCPALDSNEFWPYSRMRRCVLSRATTLFLMDTQLEILKKQPCSLFSFL